MFSCLVHQGYSSDHSNSSDEWIDGDSSDDSKLSDEWMFRSCLTSECFEDA